VADRATKVAYLVAADDSDAGLVRVEIAPIPRTVTVGGRLFKLDSEYAGVGPLVYREEGWHRRSRGRSA
jgi:hypothetical protein